MESTLKYATPLFDGKSSFTLWQSTIQDLLVQQGLDSALDDEKPEVMKESEWKSLQRKAVSTIRLALAPQVKYAVLKETSPKALWDKLEEIYASKSLTNRLFMKMELYSLKMEEGGNLHDHINSFNQLVCQLVNTGEKVEDEEQALLLLASLPKSYKSLVQTVCAGKTTLKLNEVTKILRENEKMMRGEGVSTTGEQMLAMESSARGRNHSKKRDDRRRSKSRPRDYSKVKCYYCGESGHIKHQCPKLEKDLKSLKQLQEKMKGKLKVDVSDDDDSASVVGMDSEFHLVKVENADVDCSKKSNYGWIMDSASDVHICRDRAMFVTLQNGGDFGYINVGNKLKLKVEGVGMIRLKLHNGAVKNIPDVKFVPTAEANIISLGELALYGYKYVGIGKMCKVYKGGSLVMQGRKKGNNICYLDGYSLKQTKSRRSEELKKTEKTKKRVWFSDNVEVCGISKKKANPEAQRKGEPGKSILKKVVKTHNVEDVRSRGSIRRLTLTEEAIKRIARLVDPSICSGGGDC